MTDTEIIKALECCFAKNIVCKECPYCGSYNCPQSLGKDTIDLINRQKTEIERWKAECGNQSTLWSRHYESIFETSKETIKAEAIKEFAERLKTETKGLLGANFVDDLVKEMAGDTE